LVELVELGERLGEVKADHITKAEELVALVAFLSRLPSSGSPRFRARPERS
jgi:hypothetical protein